MVGCWLVDRWIVFFCSVVDRVPMGPGNYIFVDSHVCLGVCVFPVVWVLGNWHRSVSCYHLQLDETARHYIYSVWSVTFLYRLSSRDHIPPLYCSHLLNAEWKLNCLSGLGDLSRKMYTPHVWRAIRRFWTSAGYSYIRVFCAIDIFVCYEYCFPLLTSRHASTWN